MLTEMDIHRRMDEISSEIAQIPQKYPIDITLEAIGTSGDVKVILSGQSGAKTERVISYKEDISHVRHAINNPETISDIKWDNLKEAYIDPLGYLIIVNKDATLRFKVPTDQKEHVNNIIKSLVFKQTAPPKPVKNPSRKELSYIYYFTVDGKRESVIIAGASYEQIKETALDVLTKRGIDYQKNRVQREEIK